MVSVEKRGHPHPSIDVFDVFGGWGGRLVSQTEQTRRERRNAYISENIYASAISIGHFAIFSLLFFLSTNIQHTHTPLSMCSMCSAIGYSMGSKTTVPRRVLFYRTNEFHRFQPIFDRLLCSNDSVPLFDDCRPPAMDRVEHIDRGVWVFSTACRQRVSLTSYRKTYRQPLLASFSL